jgi:hypothetical protein
MLCSLCVLRFVKVKGARSDDAAQSIGPVKLWQFVVAQTFVFPKILLSVFIGSRAAALADGDQRDHMDRCRALPILSHVNADLSSVEKWLNIGLIALSMSIGFATSWYATPTLIFELG